MAGLVGIRWVANLWRQGGEQVDMTHERSSITHSTCLRTTRIHALPPFCRSQLAENIRPLMSVTDTGVGLPNGKKDRVFHAFFTTKPHGTGMGMAIARANVESHGGRILGQQTPGVAQRYAPKYSRSGWMAFAK
jgi:nitrogen-specific signal transduction histidine kinase